MLVTVYAHIYTVCLDACAVVSQIAKSAILKILHNTAEYRASVEFAEYKLARYMHTSIAAYMQTI